MKKASTRNSTFSASVRAQRHIRAEAKRHLELTGCVITDDEALEEIVRQHAELHHLIKDFVADSLPQIDSVSVLVDALEGDAVRLIDADEDTSHVLFRNNVLAALQDPGATKSVESLRTNIGQLGIDLGWWKLKEAA